MTRQSGLGQGLSALIPEKEIISQPFNQEENNSYKEASPGHEEFVWLKIDEVKANPNQPRSNFDDVRQQELTESIKHHGILQPILVRFNNFQYEIIAGERRFRAAQAAGLDQIPAFVRDVDDQNSFEQAIVPGVPHGALHASAESEERRDAGRGRVWTRTGRGGVACPNCLNCRK